MRVSGLLIAALALAGCEHDEVCSRTRCEEPHIASTFPAEDAYWREIAGRVQAGTGLAELAPGAIVHVDSTPGLATDASWSAGDAATIVTNDFGFYRLTDAPLFYDLTVRNGNDVLFMRELTQRYVEPPFESVASPRVFAGHVDVIADPPPAEGQSVSFFVSGDQAYDAHGSLASGVDVRVRSFSNPITIHVVVHDAARGLTAPIAYGKTDVLVQAQAAATAHVPLAPVTGFAELTLQAGGEEGVVPTFGEIAVDFGARSSTHNITIVPAGGTIAFGVLPGARYLLRAHGTRGAATSDSGIVFVDPNQKTVSATLPAPPRLLAPDSNGVADPLDAATTSGVLEHVLVPQAGGGPTLHIVTRPGAARLPDLAHVGLPRPTGTYVWTARRWPTVTYEDQFSGPDLRFVQPHASSEPRVVVLP